MDDQFVDVFKLLNMERKDYNGPDAVKKMSAAYKKAANTCHPDKSAYRDATPEIQETLKNKFNQLNKAKEMLSNPDSPETQRYLSNYNNRDTFFSSAEEPTAGADVNLQPSHRRGRGRFNRPSNQS